MTYIDAVKVIRDAITAATGIPTVRVLQPGFTDGPLPPARDPAGGLRGRAAHAPTNGV